MTTPSSTSTLSFGFLLSDTARLLRRRFEQRARGTGLSRAQWQVLAHVQRREGAKQACLAEMMDIEPITLTRLLDRMEEAGWVERRPDPGDRRARLLYLTDKARPKLAEMRLLAQEIYEEILHGLSPEGRETLMQALLHVRTNLTDRPAPPEAAPRNRAALAGKTR